MIVFGCTEGLAGVHSGKYFENHQVKNQDEFILWLFFIHQMHLTCTFVEFAGLCYIPFAEPCPLSNRWPDSIDIITGQDCV